MRYELRGELARGGMGRIDAAYDHHLGREVAIKRLLVRHPQVAARFDREARITARLQHPAIVTVYEAGLDPAGEPFLVMKLVRGRSLEEVASLARAPRQRFALLPTVLAVAEAIAYAHGERIIHRDLSPSNVLCGEFGETVVIDWGLAKDLAGRDDSAPHRLFGVDRLPKTAGGSVFGTPAYMSPEQASGIPVDERADVYAIGAILYRVLAGGPPYEGRSLEEIMRRVRAGPPVPLESRQPGIPADLTAIVTKAMAREAADRYRTARGIAEDLRRFTTGQLVEVHRYSLWQRLVRRFHRPASRR